MSLTTEEKVAVTETWENVASNLKWNTGEIFKSFFKKFPETQKEFRAFADKPLEELQENKRFQAHVFTVGSALSGMIDNLDDPELLLELLRKTGQNHGRRGIKEADFKNFSACFLDDIREMSTNRWSLAAETGWPKVLDLITQTINDGLNSTD